MEVLNAKERRKSFSLFMLMLVATIGFALLTAYFTFYTPRAENKILRKMGAVNEKEMEFQKSFQEKMREVQQLLDTINKPGSNAPYLDNQIVLKLTEMTNMVPQRDTLIQSSLYRNIINNLLELQNGKRLLRGQTALEGSYDSYKQALDQLKNENRELREQVQLYRQMSNMK